MQDTVYTTGTPEDREEIIDFANMVFSQTNRPHDFKTLLPKTYADGQWGIEKWHYIAKQNGKIVGLIACRPTPLVIGGETLDCGYIGTVSVHLYHRGEGHMKALMKLMLDTEKARGRDMLILGGQRQRYNYFGFERAGNDLSFQITKRNLRHIWSEVDDSGIEFAEVSSPDSPFIGPMKELSDSLVIHGVRPAEEYLIIMHSWNSTLRAILINGDFAGYIMGGISEIALRDEQDLPRVLKAYFRVFGPDSLTLTCRAAELPRIAILTPVAETCSIAPGKMVHVFDYVRTVRALMRLQSQLHRLEGGLVTFQPEDGSAFTIRVRDNMPEVYLEDTRRPDITLPPVELERLLFFPAPNMLYPLPLGWTPLPFGISQADAF